MISTAIGIHVHSEPARLRDTIAAIQSQAIPGLELILLPDAPDPATRAVLAELTHIPQSPTDTPLGPAACLNRLAHETTADTLILLESGTIVAPGWLDKLLAALAADPRHGLASPSTNRAWNQLAAFPNAQGDPASIARTAAQADARYGHHWKSLAPLWDIGDFCLAIKRSVIDTIGPADEGYGLGPCWELDYAIRAARAGFPSVWAQGAYVFRHPFTARRQREEDRLFEASRRRYQDRFCGLRLSGQKTTYAPHCRGETCKHFAPPAAPALRPAEAPADRPRIRPVTAAGAPALSPAIPASTAAAASAPSSAPRPSTAPDAKSSTTAHAGPDPRAASPQTPTPPTPTPPTPTPPAPTPPTPTPTAPLVSCIMPTSGRPDWLPQAIEYFLAQDYPNLELIIVDASPDHRLAPLPDDPRIRRHRVPPRTPIGTMRNRACDLANGEIVIHWDDDDWYAPTRVSTQVQPILDGDADITGLHDTRFLELDSWRFWRCTPGLHARLFVRDVHGGTIAFRRRLHGAHCRYPDLSLAEDAWFIQRAIAQGARLRRIPGADLFLYLRHNANAWVFPCGSYLDPNGWQKDTEPANLATARAFYAARSRAAPPLTKPTPTPSTSPKAVAIGVYVHAEPHRLHATLAALDATTPPIFDLLLLPDSPDHTVQAALSELHRIRQSATYRPLGAAACFNRLTRETTASTLILLESGTIPTQGWLDKLRAVLAADPTHGIACPSTNRAWNRLAAFPAATADPADLARTAAEADRRFGQTWQTLAPLWDAADFCLAATRATIDATGPADEAYAEGPCWEMDYAARAARAGFLTVWARGAYVFRHPPTARRRQQEALHFEASRHRYQDKFCGLRLTGARTTYSRHCRGEACTQFAPFGNKPQPVRPKSPFVTCIMPTANRRRFIPDAIARFLAQDYPAAELLILDDGDDSIADLVPEDPSVRYLRAPRYRSLGGKRNAACEAANGEIILHWDDDDWYAPDRVRQQVEALLTTGAELCGLDRVLFYDPRIPAAWEYVYPPGGVPWVYGATLCYRREYWHMHPFPELTVGEDNAFAAAARAGELHILPDNRFFIALVHPGNTSAKNTRDPRWHPHDAAAVRALSGPFWPPRDGFLHQHPQRIAASVASLPAPASPAPPPLPTQAASRDRLPA